MPKQYNVSSEEQPKNESTFTTFLINSGYNSLAFVGKSIKYFGAKSVIAFFLGAASVYLYALVGKPLPFIDLESQRVTLQGKVITLDGQALTDPFMVGILEDHQAGPFESADGSFNLVVPKKKMYDIVVWDLSYRAFKLNGNMHLERKEDYYQLSSPVLFPTGLGRVAGEVKDMNGFPVKGTVVAGGICVPIGRDGTFELTHVPLGKVTLSVKDENRQSLFEEEIFMELAQPTPRKLISIMR